MQNQTTTIGLTEYPQISLKTLNRIRRQQKFARTHAATFELLTRREREVLTFIAEGYSNEAIGKKLFLSVHTIRTHRQNIRLQLGIHNVVEAVWWGECFDLV